MLLMGPERGRPKFATGAINCQWRREKKHKRGKTQVDVRNLPIHS